MQLDAAEVRDPGERGGVVDDREHRRVPARELHEHLVDVLGMVRGHALLVEEVPVDAVREALHVERPAPEVGECAVRDADVVGDEVALRQPALREEELVRVRDRDVVAAEAHAASIVEHMLEGHPMTDVTLEPLDDHIVLEPVDESELPSGLIVPANEAAQCRSGIVAAVGPDVSRARARRQGALPARRRLRGAPRPLVPSRPRAAARGRDRPHPRLGPPPRNGYPVARSEGWQSGRMRRSRKPLSVVRRIEGSNPSPSVSETRDPPHRRVSSSSGLRRGSPCSRPPA